MTLIILVSLFLILQCSDKKPTEPTESELPTYEQTGNIGESGGKIQISDEDSPLYGCFVEIPTGALKSATTIRIDSVKDSYFFEGDSTNLFVSLEPSGVRFEKPIKIGIPFQNVNNPNNLKAYYFNEEEYIWESLPVLEIDLNNNLIISETNHFTVFTVEESHVKFDVNLYKNNNKISANVKLLTPLNQMPTDLATFLGTGASNIRDLIRTIPFDVKAYYKVTLKEKKDYWFDPDLESKIIIWGIYSEINATTYEVRAKNTDDSILHETSDQYLTLDEVEEYYSAEPLLFNFDYSDFSSNKEYYVEVKLYYIDSYGWVCCSGGFWGTQGYYISTYESAVNFSNLNEAPDIDGDGLINDYDILIGEKPTANILNPNDGSSFSEGESIAFSGSGTDPEDGNLAGSSLVWTSNKDGQIGTGISFNKSNLSVNTHIITLTVTDNDGNTDSDNITLHVTSTNNNSPTANILNPNDGLSFSEGESITFSGSGTDPEDGNLAGSSLVWTSNKDGQIGTGTSFNKSNLSVNTHIITLTVTDSDDNTDSDNITLHVTSTNNNPPTANILNPNDGSSFSEGDPITFSGSGTDPEDGNLAGSSLVWTSNKDGQIGTGTSFNKSNLSVSTHIITLTVTDSDGNTDSDNITLYVTSSSGLVLLQQWDFAGRPDSRYENLAYDGSFLWTSDYNSNNLISLILDDTITVNSKIPDPSGGWSQYGLTWDGNNLWSCDASRDKIYKHAMDQNLTILEEYDVQADFPYALGWDGNNLWCFGAHDDKIYQINTDGSLINSFDVTGFNNTLYDLAWDGSSFWAVTWNGDKIYQCGISGNNFLPIKEYDVYKTYRIGIEWVDGYLYVVNFHSNGVWRHSQTGLDKYELR